MLRQNMANRVKLTKTDSFVAVLRGALLNLSISNESLPYDKSPGYIKGELTFVSPSFSNWNKIKVPF